MPSPPDVPGKSLVVGMTKRTRVVAAASVAGALTVGGFVVKRVLGRSEGDGEASAATSSDPIAESPSAPPGAEKKPVPKTKPKPKPAKPKTAKPKPPKPKADKPKPKPKAASAPPKVTGTDAPPKPEVEPGNISGDKSPHAALSNPVVDDPDETEYPDPYEQREDPLDPDDAGTSFGDEPHPPTGAVSTSEPPPPQDAEVGDRAEPPRRENLDK